MLEEVLNRMARTCYENFTEHLLKEFDLSDEISGTEYNHFKKVIDKVLWELTK